MGDLMGVGMMLTIALLIVMAVMTETARRAADEKLDTIHTLVNSRLSEALDKIQRLENRLYTITGEPPTGEPPQRVP